MRLLDRRTESDSRAKLEAGLLPVVQDGSLMACDHYSNCAHQLR